MEYKKPGLLIFTTKEAYGGDCGDGAGATSCLGPGSTADAGNCNDGSGANPHCAAGPSASETCYYNGSSPGGTCNANGVGDT